MAGLGDRPGELAAEDGVELAESELIGLAPLAAFLDVADHADAPPDAPSRSGSRPPRPPSSCATSRRCMALELRLRRPRRDAGG